MFHWTLAWTYCLIFPRYCRFNQNCVVLVDRRGLGFGSLRTAQMTISGYEAMNMLRKGQAGPDDNQSYLGQFNFFKHSMTEAEDDSSKAELGSSSNRIFGCNKRVRAKCILCFSPSPRK